MEELPEGWASVSLGEIASRVTKGSTPTSYGHKYQAAGIRFVKVESLRDGIIDQNAIRHHITQAAHDSQSRSALEEGDILFSIAGTIGETCLVRKDDLPANTNQALAIIRGTGQVLLPGFLRAQLRSVIQAQAREQERGGGMNNISLEDVRAFAIAVAPIGEQCRIVAQVEALLGKVGTSQERLDKIAAILKQFRQAVVTAACNGQLTADWRANQRTPGPGLKELGDERVPPVWRPVCVADVIEDLKYGTAQKCTYEKRGTPVLRIPNVANGTIDHTDLKYAVLRPKERESLRLKSGDILIIRSNGSVSLVGRPALVRMEEDGFAYAGYLIRLRPRRTIIDSRFLSLVLSSQEVRVQIELKARSTSGVNNINGEEVRALEFTLPPVDEQEEILRRVEAKFKLADRLQGRCEKGKAQVGRLTQSILAKAFRGELVPTEAELARTEGRSYETAEKLLARVKTENDNIANARPRARKKAIRR